MISYRHTLLISALCAVMTCAILFPGATLQITRAQDATSPMEDGEIGLLIDDPAMQPFLHSPPENGGFQGVPAIWIFIMGMIAMISIPVFWLVFKQKNDR